MSFGEGDLHLENEKLKRLARDMWWELTHTYSVEIVECKACGRTVVTTNRRGQPRLFCSEACRSWYRRHPEEEGQYKNGKKVVCDNLMWSLYDRLAECGVEI